ncbi:HalOD1 output domain-containing protein [Haloferax sp. YSMS24]|uniref:HalOD1 output domain-containing protein n=1 Tax=unclassified Haloferax TaxID=2625095 RepID=UPI00398CDE33
MMAQTIQWKESRVSFEEETGVYRIDRDCSEPLSTNVVMSIAAIEDIRPTQLPPLAGTIDPDALNTLFERSDDTILSFSYAGYRVTLDALGSIEIMPIDEARPVH